MCGIAGIIAADRVTGRDLSDLAVMHERIRPRGPDGEGAITISATCVARRFPALRDHADSDTRAAFSFRRLRIQDLSERADQPLTRGRSRAWILFNGEIYNHHDLRNELGGAFETTSDTEVILAAYERWGTGCFERFHGMWAIVIVDLERRKVICSRDRLGIKPLLYAVDGRRILLASDAQAIASARRSGAVPDPARVATFLAGLPQLEPTATFFDGVRQMPAASWCEFDLDRPLHDIRFNTYWDPRPLTAADARLGETEAATQFRELLEDAVRRHLIADVPVGALLSGGLDSSTITRLMALQRVAVGGEAPRTFSITYSDKSMDESPWIDAMLAQGGLHPTLLRLDPADFFDLAPQVVAAQGEPLLGHELIAQYRAFQLAHDHGVTVVLDGQGADETLGGYPFYEATLVRDHLKHLRVLDAWSEAAPIARRNGVATARLLLALTRDIIQGREKERLVARTRYPWLTAAPPPPPESNAGLARDALSRLLYVQTRWTNLPAALQYEDRNAMAHSVEARVPFLDHRLVELSFRLPPRLKIHRGDRKRILREFARPILPVAVTSRTDKKAFVSTNSWFDPRRHEDAVRSLPDAPFFENVGIEREPLRRFVDAFMRREHDDRLAIWRLHTLRLWLAQLRTGAREAAA